MQLFEIQWHFYKDRRFELMAPVNFSLVCFRYRKEGAGEDEISGCLYSKND